MHLGVFLRIRKNRGYKKNKEIKQFLYDLIWSLGLMGLAPPILVMMGQ